MSEENKKDENKKSFKEKFFSFLDKTVSVSKQGFKTAGEKISDFGDKSVQKFEISQQKNNLDKLYKELGKTVYSVLSKSKFASVTQKSEEITDLYKQIEALSKDIVTRQDNLSQSNVKNTDAEDTGRDIFFSSFFFKVSLM